MTDDSTTSRGVMSRKRMWQRRSMEPRRDSSERELSALEPEWCPMASRVESALLLGVFRKKKGGIPWGFWSTPTMGGDPNSSWGGFLWANCMMAHRHAPVRYSMDGTPEPARARSSW